MGDEFSDTSTDTSADMGSDMSSDIDSDVATDMDTDFYSGIDEGLDTDVDADMDSDFDADDGIDMDSDFDSDVDTDMDSDFDSDDGLDMDSDFDSDVDTDMDSDFDSDMDSDIDADDGLDIEEDEALDTDANVDEDVDADLDEDEDMAPEPTNHEAEHTEMDEQDEEQDEEVKDIQDDEQEQDEDVKDMQDDEQEQDEEVKDVQDDEQEQDEEVKDVQEEEEEKNEDTQDMQDDEHEQDEEVKDMQDDEQEQDEEVKDVQDDEQEQDEDVKDVQEEEEEKNEDTQDMQEDEQDQKKNANDVQEEQNIDEESLVNEYQQNNFSEIRDSGSDTDAFFNFRKRKEVEDQPLVDTDEIEKRHEIEKKEFGQGLKDSVKPPDEVVYREDDGENKKMDHGQRERGGLYGNDPRHDYDEDADKDNMNDQLKGNEISKEEQINATNFETDMKEMSQIRNLDTIEQIKEDNTELYMQSCDAINDLERDPDRKEELNLTKSVYGQEMQKKSDKIQDLINSKQAEIGEIPKENMNEEQYKKYEQYQKDIEALQREQEFCQDQANKLLQNVDVKTKFVGVNGMDFSEMDSKFIREQGKEVEHFKGTCGECSIANAIRALGGDMTEKEVVDYARKNNLCVDMGDIDYNEISEKTLTKLEGSNGGTSIADRRKILNGLGYNCETRYDQTLQDVQKQLEQNKSAILNLDARVLDKHYGNVATIEASNHIAPVEVPIDEAGNIIEKYRGTNHAVTVKGIQVNENGEPTGIWVHDTGRNSSMGRSCLITAEEFNKIVSTSKQSVQYISARKNI